MSPDLMNLPTQWSVLRRAAAAPPGDPTRRTELNGLLQYYLPAVRAYLHGCCRGDADRADELVQKFSLHFLEGGFRHANPEKGPFRFYLKRSLSNLVGQDLARRRESHELPSDVPAPDPAARLPGEQEFEFECMKLLVNRAMAAFEEEFASVATPYAAALRLAMDPATGTNDQRAETLSARRGEPYTVDRFKKILSRARHAFARHLYQEVARGFDAADADAVADELAALGLLGYCEEFVRSPAPATG